MKWIYVSLCLILSACALFEDPSETGSTGLEEAFTLHPGIDDYRSIPPALWSPDQRRSTAGYYYLVAQYESYKGNAEVALPLYEAAYGLDPNAFLAGKTIESRFAFGVPDKALVEARRVILLYPENAHLRFLYGKVLVRFGMFEHAAEQLNHAIRLDPVHEYAYALLIEMNIRSRDLIKAIVLAKELTNVNPGSVLGWSWLARLYVMNNRMRQALHPAKKAHDLAPTSPETNLVYAYILERNGHSNQAVRLYEKMYRFNPTNEEVMKRMVALYHQLGGLDAALELLNEVAKKSGYRPGLEMQRAYILWEQKKYSEAAVILARLAENYPESDKALYLAALGQEKIEKLDSALMMYDNIDEKSPLYLHAAFRSASIYMFKKQYSRVIERLELILSKDEKRVEVYELYGAVLAAQNKNREAIEMMRNGFAKLNRPHLLFLMGVYQEKSGDINACIETMTQVIQLDPKNSSAYNYLGYIYAELGQRLNDAEMLIKKALEIKPNDGFYLDSLAWVYHKMGKNDLALEILEQAKQLLPGEGVILEHMGEALIAKGQRREGIQKIREALEKRLEPKDRRRIRTRLNELAEVEST